MVLKNRDYTCEAMTKKILNDSFNLKLNKSNIYPEKFNKPCKRNYYKGALVIQKGKNISFL